MSKRIDPTTYFDANVVARVVGNEELGTVSSDSAAYGLAIILDSDSNVVKHIERGEPPRQLGEGESALIATNEILRICFLSGVPNSDNKRAVGIKFGRLTETKGAWGVHKENTVNLRATLEFQIDRHNRKVADEIYALMKEHDKDRLTKKELLSAIGNDLKEDIQDFLQTAINKMGAGNLGMGNLRSSGMEELSPLMHDQGLVFKRIACNIDKRSKWGRLIVPNLNYDHGWVLAAKLITPIATATVTVFFGLYTSGIILSPKPTVTIGSHTNGSVVIERNDCASSSECEVEDGSDLTLNISANEGYKLVDLACSGECPSGLEPAASVSIQNIEGDFTITPKFRDTRTLNVDNRNAEMGNATCTVDGQSGSECAEVPGGMISLEATATPTDSDSGFRHVFDRWDCTSDSWCGGLNLSENSINITVPEALEPLSITPIFRRDRLVTLRIRPSSPSGANVAIATLEDECLMSDGCAHFREGATEVYIFQTREGASSPNLTIMAPAPSNSDSLFSFAEWQCDVGQCPGGGSTAPLTLDADITIKAVYTMQDVLIAENIDWTWTATEFPAEVCTTEDTTLRCVFDEDISITISPRPMPDRRHIGWRCSGSACDGQSFIEHTSISRRFDSSVTLTPEYRDIVFANLTIGRGVNGRATADCGSNCRREEGWEVTVTATPDSGYRLEGWDCTGSCPSGNPRSPVRLTINRDTSITPEFREIPFATLTIGSAMNGGRATADCGSNCRREAGWEVTVTARPDRGYTFERWECTGSCPSGNPRSSVRLTINRDTHITPEFREIPFATLTIGSANGGSATADCESDCRREPGWEVTVTASPDSGYTWEGWDCSGSCPSGTPSASVRLTIDQDTLITPKFREVPTVTLIIRVGEGGHLDRRSDDGITSSCEGGRTCRYEIETGKRIHVDADPEDDYKEGEWRTISGDDFSNVSNFDIDITLTRDTELEVTFIDDVHVRCSGARNVIGVTVRPRGSSRLTLDIRTNMPCNELRAWYTIWNDRIGSRFGRDEQVHHDPLLEISETSKTTLFTVTTPDIGRGSCERKNLYVVIGEFSVDQRFNDVFRGC